LRLRLGGDKLSCPGNNGTDPSETLERRWQEEVVRTALVDLRPTVGKLNYQILHLHFWEDRTAAQIADVLGLTPPEVSARRYRLLKKLRARILAYCGADFRPVL
jgi:RNA polymerase sigma factor (sigma-70 family)